MLAQDRSSNIMLFTITVLISEEQPNLLQCNSTLKVWFLVAEYSTLLTNQAVGNDARSQNVLNPLVMGNILSSTSDVTLNIVDCLVDGYVLNIDPKDLFPKNEKRVSKKT